MGRLIPRACSRASSGRLRTFPGKVSALLLAFPANDVAASLFAAACSFASLSLTTCIFEGLVMPTVLAVAVGAVLPRLARLVTLAGLVNDFSSNGIGLGIDIALATMDIPSLSEFVDEGASCGLLIPLPAADIRDDSTLWPGFSLVALPWVFCCSSRRRRSSSIAAAPVNGAGENLGEKAGPNLGDFDKGDTVKPASAMGVRAEAMGDESGRLRFNDFAPAESAVGCVVVVVDRVVVVSGTPRISAGGMVGGARPCSDAMKRSGKGALSTYN